MKYSDKRFTLVALSGVLSCLAGCTLPPQSAPVTVSSVNPPAVHVVSAAESRFRYEGRFDFSNPASPVVVWQGSRIRLDFAGPALKLRFGPAVDQNVFNLTVDGHTEIVAVPAGAHSTYTWPHDLSANRHQLTLFKRSEAAAGQVQFAGVEIAPDAQAWAPAAMKYRLRMEFFGDSITAGACNEDGATDQWEDRRTHNNALSYSTLSAAAFGADYRSMAISGMGISIGYVDVKAGEAWDKIYPRADSPAAELAAWQPEVAFVNFGENDDSFARSSSQQFPASFAKNYVALVKAIRAAYPHAQLVLLRGGMYGGAKGQELRAAWEAAVQELESADPAISHFVFAHWSSNHPRVSDDRAMADELIAWLKQQSFMQRFL